jgi:hypothetical protein
MNRYLMVIVDVEKVISKKRVTSYPSLKIF